MHKEYAEAVQILSDLRDLAERGGQHQNADFTARLARLRQTYAKRRGLMVAPPRGRIAGMGERGGDDNATGAG